MVVDIAPFAYPDSARNTVNVGKRLGPEDFDIAAPEGAAGVRVRVIGVIENQAPTRALEADLAVEAGTVMMDRAGDVCQVALVERHRGTGQVVNGFVSGFGYTSDCAVASTVAHDSHHMIVVGTSKADMALAANRLAEVGGGVVVFANGEEKALVEMPIAGLMSDQPAEVVAAKADRMVRAMAGCGCTLNNAYMQHSLLALVPEIRHRPTSPGSRKPSCSCRWPPATAALAAPLKVGHGDTVANPHPAAPQQAAVVPGPGRLCQARAPPAPVTLEFRQQLYDYSPSPTSTFRCRASWR
jgi:adenine deaminase